MICITIFLTTIFGCDRVSNSTHTLLPDGGTQTVAVSCHTFLGFPVLCWVVNNTVRHVEVETIVEKIVEVVVVEEKRTEVPVETIIERVVYITEIGETQEILDIVEYTVGAIREYIPPEGFKEVPISDVTEEVIEIIESTPPAIQPPVQGRSSNVISPPVQQNPPNGAQPPAIQPTVRQNPPNVAQPPATQPTVRGNWCFTPYDPGQPPYKATASSVHPAGVFEDTTGCIYATFEAAVRAQNKHHGFVD